MAGKAPSFFLLLLAGTIRPASEAQRSKLPSGSPIFCCFSYQCGRMPECLIGLGSNLGDRASLLEAAIAGLWALPQVRVLSRSGVHETPSAGGPTGQRPFLNGAVLVDTGLAPERLLDEVGRIETDLGRRRVERWGPRPIDLDLLLYDDVVVASTRLQLPHPRMAWRRFVLAPSAEVAPAMRHPQIGWTVRQLLDHLDAATTYIAIGGPSHEGRARLARTVAAQFDGRLITDPLLPDSRRSDPDKSYGFEADAEIEFAERRAEVLDVDSPIWTERRPFWISNFWLGQSSAAVRALPEGSQRTGVLERWHEATRHARRPKLTVLLDGPAQEGEATLPSIRQFVSGPLLEVDGQRPADALEELGAALLAMDS